MKTKKVLRQLRKDLNSLMECQCALCTEVSDLDEVLRALCTQVDELATRERWYYYPPLVNPEPYTITWTCAGNSTSTQGGAKYDAVFTMPPRDESQPVCCYEGAHIEDGHVVTNA
jgi:hypothetical protein